MASSLVGAKIKALTVLSASIVSKIGIPNAAVFPVPVCACPIKCVLSFSNSGITSFCISLGSSNPFLLKALSISILNPKSSNFCIIFYFTFLYFYILIYTYYLKNFLYILLYHTFTVFVLIFKNYFLYKVTGEFFVDILSKKLKIFLIVSGIMGILL